MYFCPSEGRTTYVEDAFEAMPPEHWRGAAAVMGNSVRQWHSSYSPKAKQRCINRAVAAQAAHVSSLVRNMASSRNREA